jgi:cbb3-type cytochrome oxidase cytochrome c subunit
MIARLAIALVSLTVAISAVSGRLSLAQNRGALIAQGRQLFSDKGCYGCHTIGVAGTRIGPDLAQVGSRYPESKMARWLREPSAHEPPRHPRLDLNDAEATTLAAYLATLR